MEYIIDHTGLLFTKEEFTNRYPTRDYTSLDTILCDSSNLIKAKTIYYELYRGNMLPCSSSIITESFTSNEYYYVTSVVGKEIFTRNCSYPYDEKIWKNKFVILTDK